MKQGQKNIFTGGMDMDNSRYLIAEDDYISALNVRNGIGEGQSFNEVTNVKGNTLSPYVQPSGQNIVIGEYENKQDNSVYYAVYNSNSQHQWRRYLNGTIERVIEFDFGWDKTKINHINIVDNKYLLWTDSKPRKIDINKCLDNKQRKYNLYQIGNFNGQIRVLDGTTVLAGVTLSGADADTLATNINTSLLSQYITASVCDGYVELEFDDVNEYIIEETAANAILVAENFYTEIKEYQVDAARYPKNCPPTVSIKNDTEFSSNLIEDKIFQFTTQLVFEDNQKSTLAPWSDISFDVCKRGNYLEVDYTEDRLNNADDLADIKSVNIIVREQNDGTSFIVQTIEKKDFWTSNFTSNTYNFYNNEQRRAVEPTLEQRQWDNIFIEPTDNKYSICQEFADNRIMYSNGVENYEKPCEDYSVDINLTPNNEPRFTLEGLVRIYNPAFFGSGRVVDDAGRSGYIGNNGPDSDSETNSYWGGRFGTNFSDDIGTRLKQWIPLNGFTFYLAGTDYFATSKQNQATVLQNDGGAVLTSTQDEIDDVADYINSGGDFFSVFSIKNVPAGKYVVRMASPLISYGDVLGYGSMYDINNGRAWHKTSGNLRFYNSGDGIYVDNIPTSPLTNANDVENVKEVTVEIDSNGNFTVSCYLGVLVQGVASNNICQIGQFLVDDLAVYDAGTGGALSGYLFDSLGLTSIEEISQSPNAELVLVGVDAPPSPPLGPYTDHNGYFAYAINPLFVAVLPPFFYDKQNTKIGGGNYYLSTESILLDIYDNKSSLLTDNIGLSNEFGNKAVQIAGFLDGPDYRNENSTFIEGRVVDSNGDGVPDVSVLYERNGRQELSDANGNFKILIYSDNIDITSGVKRVLDSIYLQTTLNCKITFSNNSFYENTPQITPIGLSGFNPTNPFNLGTINATIADFVFTNQLKLGGKYNWYIVHHDEVNRQHQPKFIGSTDIPYFTDTYQGTVVGDGVFNATINLGVINNTQGFTGARILRTPDLNRQSNFIQIPISDIKYVDYYDENNDVIFEVSPETSTATEIWLNITEALQSYKDYNSGSNKGYAFTEGDRIKFIRKSTGELFSTIELPIKREVNGYIVIDALEDLGVLESGVLIEVYSPRLTEENPAIYEIPLCIEVNQFGNYIIDGSAVTSVTVNTGGAYRRNRVVPVAGVGSFVSFVEDPEASDFFPSVVEDFGRINIEGEDFGRLLRTNATRFSNVYTTGALINGINSFEPANVQETPRDHGYISKTILTNDDTQTQVLLVIHSQKTGTYYLNRRVANYSDANQIISYASSVLGDLNTLQGDYGTQHPESVSQEDDRVYYLDANRKKVIAYSVNKLFPISDLNAKNYFDKLNPRTAVSVYDDYHEEYIITIEDDLGTATLSDAEIDGDRIIYQLSSFSGQLKTPLFIDDGVKLIPAEIVSDTSISTLASIPVEGTSVTLISKSTLAYCEPKKKWTTFYSFSPEQYSALGENIVSFKDGELWLHDTNNTYNNFYGEQYSSILRFVSKSVANKTFWGIREIAGSVWSCSEIIIPPNSSYPTGMLSRVKSGNFKLEEGDWWADFRRDINDPNPNLVTELEKLLRGRRLRGETMEVELTNNDTNKTFLRMAEIFQALSQITT
jgi:hypothetical protein